MGYNGLKRYLVGKELTAILTMELGCFPLISLIFYVWLRDLTRFSSSIHGIINARQTVLASVLLYVFCEMYC